MRTTKYSSKVITLLKQLHTTYPSQSLALHIGIACSEYGQLSTLSDEELHIALSSYITLKESDPSEFMDINFILEDEEEY